MLTRLRVSGFKNLVDVEVYFGPFTCIAGANGVGKSNLFDAIAFLSALALKNRLLTPLCACEMKEDGVGMSEVCFTELEENTATKCLSKLKWSFREKGTMTWAQPAEATITFLRYALVSRYRPNEGQRAVGGLEILKEELTRIKLGDAAKHPSLCSLSCLERICSLPA